MRRTVFLIASVLVSALFLWLALRDVPIADVLTSIQQADIVLVFVGLLTVGLGLFTRAIRWRGLVGNKVSVMQAFHMLNITMLLNQLPLRAGEVARSVLATRAEIPLMTAATSIVIERLLDVLFVVVALSLALTQSPDAPPDVASGAAVMGIIAVAAFMVLIFFARFPHIAHAVLAFVERLLPFLKRLHLVRLLDHILDGLRPLTNWRTALHAVVWTIISWGISTITFCLLIMSIGVTENVVLMAVLSLTLASLSIAIPVSVAAIGPYQAAVRVAGETVRMANVTYSALGFLIHGVNILGYAILGVIGMLALGVSLSDVTGSANKSLEPAEAEAAPQPR